VVQRDVDDRDEKGDPILVERERDDDDEEVR
jgi:hypothetical protein